jgi:hypothetical protein
MTRVDRLLFVLLVFDCVGYVLMWLLLGVR